MGNVDDISQLCRLCLVKDQVNIPIFEETSDIGQTFLKINSCLPVKVSRDDNLPKKICDGCSYKLDMLYTFRNTSADSEKQLISWLNQAGLGTITQTSLKDPLANTKPEITVKQETFDTTDNRTENDNQEMGVDAQTYLIQQQLPYEQEFEFGEPSGSGDEMPEEPAPKRTKRAAALKKAPLDETDDGEDDLERAMQITKAEDEDSEDVDQPDYVEAPSTSADDQPGPSGVGKTAVEAPTLDGPRRIIRRCKKCPETFTTLSQLIAHRRIQHIPLRFFCDVCGKGYRDQYSLRSHGAMHSDEKPYSCDVCDEKFKNVKYLYRHKRSHSEKKLTCPHCGKTYRYDSLTSFANHCKQHSAKKVACDVCGKILFENYMESHKNRRHNTEYKPPKFPCDRCDKICSSKSLLKKHVQTQHEGQRHLCETCGKALLSIQRLRDHMKIHTGEKPFVCGYCEKRFACKKYLKEHLKVHTKDKPHVCTICDKKYTQRSTLTLHIRSAHTGEKPHLCSVCDKGFVSKSLLNSHMKSHTKTVQ